VQELRDYLEQGDERGIDIAQADLQDELYDLNREAYLYESEDEQEGNLINKIGGTLKRTFALDDDIDDSNLGYPGRAASWDDWGDSWDYDRRPQPGYDQPAYGNPPPYQPEPPYRQGPPAYQDRSPYRDQPAYPDDRPPERRYRDQDYANDPYRAPRDSYGSRPYPDDAYPPTGAPRPSRPDDSWSAEPPRRDSRRPNRPVEPPAEGYRNGDARDSSSANGSAYGEPSPPRQRPPRDPNRPTPRYDDENWGDEDEWF
jgi:molecular chaperone DnaK